MIYLLATFFDPSMSSLSFYIGKVEIWSWKLSLILYDLKNVMYYIDCCVVIIQSSKSMIQAIPQHDTKYNIYKVLDLYKQALKYLKVISLKWHISLTPYKQCLCFDI
jgi:hypothetical protein